MARSYLSRFLLASVLGAALVPAAAESPARIDRVFQPPASLLVQIETGDVWAEVYPVKEAQAEAAMQRAVKDGDPPSPAVVAVVFGGALHFAQGKKAVSLAETASELTRDQRPTEYDEACKSVPTPGDRLVLRYADKAGQYSAELDVRLMAHYAYGSLIEGADPVRLDLSNPAHCSAQHSSRTFYRGKLVLKHKGLQTDSQDVLLQSLVEPS